MDNIPIHPEKSKLWEVLKEIGFWCAIVPVAVIAALCDVIIELRWLLLSLAAAGTAWVVYLAHYN